MTPRGRAALFGAAGTTLLGLSMTRKPGSRSFYALTAAVAGTWAAGALDGGDVEVPEAVVPRRDSVLEPVLTGVAAFGVFTVLRRVARLVPPIDRAVNGALSYAEHGSTPLVLATACANGVAEEMFFRGRLWSLARGRRPIVATTAAYTAMTTATRNPSLVGAAAVMGALFGCQRDRTGGVRASAITHVTWSALMICALPRGEGR